MQEMEASAAEQQAAVVRTEYIEAFSAQSFVSMMRGRSVMTSTNASGGI